MKKVLAVILLLTLVISITGCSSTGKPAAPATPAAPANDKFPSHPITFIVGYEPGGTSDGICRLIAAYMAEELKQPVIIENMPGASNMVALNSMINRGKDGYTITMSASADSPWAYEVTLPDQVKWKASDFTILGRMTSAPSSMGIIVDKKKWKTLPEFVKYVKSQPAKKVNYGILGPGRLDDPQLEELQKLLGVQFNVVHYTSSNSIQTDILSGDLAAGTIGANRQNFLENESFRVLALYGRSVPPEYPVRGIPFLADYEKELGFNFNDAKFIPLENGGTNVLSLSSIDPKIQQAYKDALKRVSENKEYKEKMMKMSFPSMMDTEASLKFMAGIQEALKAAVASAKNAAPAKK